MNIDPLKRQQPPMTLRGVTRRAQPDESHEQRNDSGSVMDNINRQDLVQQLKDMPEVRSDVVAKGKQLAEDPSYPPDEVIDSLAKMFAGMSGDWLVDVPEDIEIAPEQ